MHQNRTNQIWLYLILAGYTIIQSSLNSFSIFHHIHPNILIILTLSVATYIKISQSITFSFWGSILYSIVLGDNFHIYTPFFLFFTLLIISVKNTFYTYEQNLPTLIILLSCILFQFILAIYQVPFTEKYIDYIKTFVIDGIVLLSTCKLNSILFYKNDTGIQLRLNNI